MKRFVLMITVALTGVANAGMSASCEKATIEATTIAMSFAIGKGSYKKMQVADKKAEKICQTSNAYRRKK